MVAKAITEIIKVTTAIMMIMDMVNKTKNLLIIALVVILFVLSEDSLGTVNASSLSSYSLNEYTGGEGSGDSGSEGGDSVSSSGYTPEQIAAAKAWLSAHGYAPTRAGAAAAYQDYLSGKLDNDPDVRRYKGLDDTNTSSADSSSDNVSLNETNNSPSSNVSQDSAATNVSADSSDSTEANTANTTNASAKTNDATGEADMTEFLEIVADGEDAEALADTEGSKKYDPFGAKIYALKDKLEITSNDSSVYLLENATEEEYKKSSDQKAFVVIILAIFIVLISGIILIINRGKQKSEL